jgi:hypothetical protein
MSDEWIFFPPNYAELYEINTFDDGYESFQTHENQWVMYGTWRGKCALINRTNSAINIDSISQWKLWRVF